MKYMSLRNAYELVEHFTDLHEIHEKVVGVNMSDELPEQELIFRFIRGDAKVLELGGNIGRSSIVISKVLQKPHHHVVLESDPEIVKELVRNKQKNKCGFQVVNAALSEKPMIQNGWTTQCHDPQTTIPHGWKVVPTITLQQLMTLYPIPFDTLVVDCEGCLEPILRSYPFFLDNIHTIIIENDAQFISEESNNFIGSFIRKKGFRNVECRPLNHYPCFYQVWLR